MLQIARKDGVTQSYPFFEEPVLEPDGQKQLEVEGAKKSLSLLLEKLSKSPWDGIEKSKGKALLKETAIQVEVKQGLIMKSLRAALLGSMKGPDLMDSWALLARVGKDTSRLRRSL